MCTAPRLSQKRGFGDWVFEFDGLFMKFDTLPLSEVLDKTATMLMKSTKPRDREAWDPIGRKLNKKKREIYKLEMQGGSDYVVITKKRLFDLLWLYFQKSEGEVLSDIRTQINNLDSISPLEIGECCQTP